MILSNLKIQNPSPTQQSRRTSSWRAVCLLSLNDSRLFSWCSSRLLLDRYCPSKARVWSVNEKCCDVTGIVTIHHPLYTENAQSRLVFGVSFVASFRCYVSKQTLARELAPPQWEDEAFHIHAESKIRFKGRFLKGYLWKSRSWSPL